eukprot:804796-Rhodomonas_salina.3
MEHYILSVEDILARHRPPNSTYTTDFLTSPRVRADIEAADLWAGDGGLGLDLEQDRNLRFVLDSFDGDLFQGTSTSPGACCSGVRGSA